MRNDRFISLRRSPVLSSIVPYSLFPAVSAVRRFLTEAARGGSGLAKIRNLSVRTALSAGYLAPFTRYSPSLLQKGPGVAPGKTARFPPVTRRFATAKGAVCDAQTGGLATATGPSSRGSPSRQEAQSPVSAPASPLVDRQSPFVEICCKGCTVGLSLHKTNCTWAAGNRHPCRPGALSLTFNCQNQQIHRLWKRHLLLYSACSFHVPVPLLRADPAAGAAETNRRQLSTRTAIY